MLRMVPVGKECLVVRLRVGGGGAVLEVLEPLRVVKARESAIVEASKYARRKVGEV